MVLLRVDTYVIIVSYEYIFLHHPIKIHLTNRVLEKFNFPNTISILILTRNYTKQEVLKYLNSRVDMVPTSSLVKMKRSTVLEIKDSYNLNITHPRHRKMFTISISLKTQIITGKMKALR